MKETFNACLLLSSCIWIILLCCYVYKKELDRKHKTKSCTKIVPETPVEEVKKESESAWVVYDAYFLKFSMEPYLFEPMFTWKQDILKYLAHKESPELEDIPKPKVPNLLDRINVKLYSKEGFPCTAEDVDKHNKYLYDLQWDLFTDKMEVYFPVVDVNSIQAAKALIQVLQYVPYIVYVGYHFECDTTYNQIVELFEDYALRVNLFKVHECRYYDIEEYPEHPYTPEIPHPCKPTYSNIDNLYIRVKPYETRGYLIGN